jgi:hypothetical protein
VKVDFIEDATVSITPENAIENYALKKWFEAYSKMDGNSHECLHVNLFTETFRAASNNKFEPTRE